MTYYETKNLPHCHACWLHILHLALRLCRLLDFWLPTKPTTRDLKNIQDYKSKSLAK